MTRTIELFKISINISTIGTSIWTPLLGLVLGHIWSASGAVVYRAIEILGVDAMLYIKQWDAWGIQSHVDPEWGTIGLTVAMNEILEPSRLSFVLMTVKPVIDTLRPPTDNCINRSL